MSWAREWVDLNILIVKLSSLGDVLHNVPIIWDIRKYYPNARMDWVVEEAYVELLKPLQSTTTFKGIDHIIPIALRRWKKAVKRGDVVRSLREFKAMRHELNRGSYDVVIETQGLIKSALVSRLAKRQPNALIVGLGNRVQHSGYEPIARLFYTDIVHVDTKSHAVDCSRQVAAGALNMPIPNRENNPPQFYPQTFIDALKEHPNPLGLAKGDYVLCFHATARATKCWDLNAWTFVGEELARRGLTVVYPWGNSIEKETSEILASKLPSALVPRAFTMTEAFILIAQARLTIGVDTGLTHLASMLGVPTVELYVDSPRWKTEGYWRSTILNLGDKGHMPTPHEVNASLNELLAG